MAHPDLQHVLFNEPAADDSVALELAPGLFRVRGLVQSGVLLDALEAVIAAAPWRHMQVRGGGHMSVAMSNCGQLGWVSDLNGYRYSRLDPSTGRPWPAMPTRFAHLAHKAAALCGFEAFEPDACLVNRYERGAGLGLHQDRNEIDVGQPIVSVSIGASATFLWGGARRTDAVRRLAVHDGDVLVWGGPSRLNYHGVLPLVASSEQEFRINLTLRCAGATR
jgi:DNA oxidative demethylase